MQSMLRVGFLVIGLSAGCARDTDASGDAPALGHSMADAGRDAGAEQPMPGTGADPGGGDMTPGGGGAGTGSTAGAMGPSAGPDAGSASGVPGTGGGGGLPTLGGDGGFDPCDIENLPSIPGLPPLPEGGLMIPGCP